MDWVLLLALIAVFGIGLSVGIEIGINLKIK